MGKQTANRKKMISFEIFRVLFCEPLGTGREGRDGMRKVSVVL